MNRTIDSEHPQPSTEVFSGVFIRSWMLAALIFFFVAALFGTLMRYFFIEPIPFLEYKHLLHAHSHTALLSWAFMLVSGGILFLIVPQSPHRRQYRILFVVNVAVGAGLAGSFLIQGYGAFSIVFSSLHLLAVYGFAMYILKDLRRCEQTNAIRFIRWSVYWLLISTLGVWAAGPVKIYLGKLHPLYYASIQFFLHFQFNGWFTYAILGMMTFFLHRKGIDVPLPNHGFRLLHVSLIFTYALSITWSTPVSVLFYLNSLGVLLQVVAFYLLVIPLMKAYHPMIKRAVWTDRFLQLGLACFIIKVLTQLAVALPIVATISYTIHNYVIGFIHLIMLGSISLTGAGILLKAGIFPINKRSQVGWYLLLSSFVLTEVILFGQGTLLWLEWGFVKWYYEILFSATALLPVSILIILSGFTTRPGSYSQDFSQSHPSLTTM